MAAGLLVVALGASAAFAYWTASGTGSGTAHAGTDAGVSILGVGFSATLYPDATVSVRFAVRNDSSNTAVEVGKVVADQGALNDNGTPSDTSDDFYQWPNGISTSDSLCLPGDFHYSGTGNLNHEIAASDTYLVGVGSGGTLHMDDSAVNQDHCKNATITLHLKTDNSGI